MEPQLENIFPDYKNLLNREENHRKNIINLGEYRQKHYQYNLMYGNVFSVMGKETRERPLKHLRFKR